jgi:hypothetical protein
MGEQNGAQSAQGGEPETVGEPKPGATRLVFDDPLDRQTSDDTDRGWGERPGGAGGRGLDWYLSQRPPHHGE